MRKDPEGIVEAFYRAWLVRDVEAALAYCDDRIRVAQHFSDPALPFTGETVGTADFRARLLLVARSWEFLSSDPVHSLVGPETIKSHCPFVIRHLATGEVFDGTFRHLWGVRDGRIIALDEYIDIARLKAFLRLLEAPAASA
jgi:ketosteroid isomerase-like protein